ncbi:membrane protein [Neisseria arctica]|uniref:Membrane protein n=1 Tax=Neisseria arctica TaxID=1470200 RepID=A0A0J0YQB7_9NEIS|nr:membrane protein [Neisseria arctica]KLT72327.1 membrane protein [Neisseria arctica]UOO85968.1 hypothetical protein LVJ86_06950 [Neisseria arctica]
MRTVWQIILALLSVAYPLLWYWGRDNGAFYWLAGLMCGLWLLRAFFSRENSQRTVAVIVAAFFAIVLWLRLPQTMYWYPVGVSLLMLAVFGGSLFAKQSVIERLARLQNPDLPPEGVRYTRKVTQIWCVFFILNALAAAVLVCAEQYEWWAFYTGIISYVLMGMLLGGEWLYRKMVLRL